MKSFELAVSRARLIRLRTGEDILPGLTRACGELGIDNGVIAAGVGSTTAAHVHVVKSTNVPPGNVYLKHDAPFDLVGMQGLIMSGRVHAHVSFAGCEDGMMIGGHLEEGCPVLTFCVITVLPTGPIEDLDAFGEAKQE